MPLPENPMFHVVYGRNLLRSLAETANPPYLIVTMPELLSMVKEEFEERNIGYVHFALSLDINDLENLAENLPQQINSVIGIGGGRALDVAKYVAWRKNLPLFQLPTATSTNAAFTHRIAVRIEGVVKYIGWAIPQVVYIDFDIIKRAPPHLNRAGVGDVFCIHTALYDWKLATERSMEKLWPWDPELAEEARKVLQTVRNYVDEIANVTETGIRILTEAHRWTGAVYHNAGWNPRPIEGCEHFFYYTLEYITRKAYIHGEIVCLGILFMSVLQDNDPEDIWRSIKAAKVRIKPEEIGEEWSTIEKALKLTRKYAIDNKLFYTTIHEREITDEIIKKAKDLLYSSQYSSV
ncbi:MAG: iron-containing alcohol dehydrogenase [Desulfurococcaceae archaeon]|nr:iron-containing alcohol dehydrogenase [Desulfurococcaceae archaeon]